MITAAVYSAGPTLIDCWKGGYGIGICVNGASLIVPQREWQWLCCADLDCFAEDSPYPTPSVGCFAMFAGKIPVGRRFVTKDWRTHLTVPWLAAGARPAYTVSMALAIAHSLGADVIDLYGHDGMVGRTNCEGKTDPAYLYTESRAAREAEELRQVQNYLALHHVTVIRK